MNKHLPDNIDDFFSDHLKNYTEEPEENAWNEIDKRLSEQEKRRLPKFAILSAAAVIVVCLISPLFINDLSIHSHQFGEKHSPGKKINEYNKTKRHSSSVVPAQLKNAVNVNSWEKQVTPNNINLYALSQKDFYIIKRPSYSLNELYTEAKQQQPGGLNALKFFKDSLQGKDNLNESKSASIVVKLSKKHNFSISPFFSADHITGRFIDEYEFDNLNKDDLSKREKSDMSFTAGLLAGYQLNKKFSLVSGISYSSSKLSVTGGAVKALQNNNGQYKFKLATSYGFAELTKTGIVPAAGDTLLVSSAGIIFNYISIPLLINYDLPGKKIRFSVHGGVAFNKLTRDKVEAEYIVQNNNEAETINKIEGVKRTFFTLNTGIEAKYALNHTTDISIGPELRYGINSINKGTPVKTYPVNYGLVLKLNFKL